MELFDYDKPVNVGTVYGFRCFQGMSRRELIVLILAVKQASKDNRVLCELVFRQA